MKIQMMSLAEQHICELDVVESAFLCYTLVHSVMVNTQPLLAEVINKSYQDVLPNAMIVSSVDFQLCLLTFKFAC